MTERPVICFPFVGDDIGGSHISAAGLIRNIDPARFQPLVLLQHMDGEMARFFRNAGIDFEAAPNSARLVHGRTPGAAQAWGLLAGTLPLASFLNRRHVAIVHSNDGRTHATWALAARLSGAQLLWHHRGDPDAKGLRYAAPLLANKVVTVSRFALPRPGRFSAAGRARVVHSPFMTDLTPDRENARQTLVDELGCPADTVLIGFFGALIPRKRPLLFVDAVAALRRRLGGRPVLGLVFGESFDGADRQICERARESGVSDGVKLMGFRNPGTFWLAGCDMLMVPAVNEPFGRTLIEAMLVETPVIATASGGNVEALRHGETGLLVPPENAEALAAAAEHLLRTPDLARTIVIAAAAEARDRFGEDRHASAIMALYDEMLGKWPVAQSPRVAHGGAATG